MTCQELIMKLKQLPADATILVWDIDLEGITTTGVELVFNEEGNDILITS